MAKSRDRLASILGIEPFEFKDDLSFLTEDSEYISVWKGNKHTEESKRAIGNANRGKKRSLESRERMRVAKLGKKRGPHSEAHRAKLSESLKRFGPHSDERRRNQSIAAKRRYNNEEANKDH